MCRGETLEFEEDDLRLLCGGRLVGCQTIGLLLWGGEVRGPEDSALRQLPGELGLGKRGLRVHAQLEDHVGWKGLLA